MFSQKGHKSPPPPFAMFWFECAHVASLCDDPVCPDGDISRPRTPSPSLPEIWGRTSSVDGFFLRATRLAGSRARSGASCSGRKGGGSYTLVCARPPCGKSPMKDKRDCKDAAELHFNVGIRIRDIFATSRPSHPRPPYLYQVTARASVSDASETLNEGNMVCQVVLLHHMHLR